MEAEEALLRQLCATPLLLCSPLTRALQTCLIGLAPILASRAELTVTLAPNARERFTGGADCVGCALGEAAIRARAEAATSTLYPENHRRAVELCAPPMDATEARSRWWSIVPESAEEAGARVADLFAQLRHSAHGSAVVVGHSNLWREVFKAQAHDDLAERKPGLLSKLRSRKLENCGVVCADLDFGRGDGKRPIVDAALLSGTMMTLVPSYRS